MCAGVGRAKHSALAVWHPPCFVHLLLQGGRQLLCKQSFRPLRDLETLARWKDAFRPYYCGALLKGAELWVKDLGGGGRP